MKGDEGEIGSALLPAAASPAGYVWRRGGGPVPPPLPVRPASPVRSTPAAAIGAAAAHSAGGAFAPAPAMSAWGRACGSPHAPSSPAAHGVLAPAAAQAASRPQAGVQLSFAQVLLQSLSPTALPLVAHAPASTDLGEPAAFFTMEEVNISCRPLEYAIIARTPRGRPPFQDIRSHLAQRFRFKQDFVISAMDA